MFVSWMKAPSPNWTCVMANAAVAPSGGGAVVTETAVVVVAVVEVGASVDGGAVVVVAAGDVAGTEVAGAVELAASPEHAAATSRHAAIRNFIRGDVSPWLVVRVAVAQSPHG